MQHPGFIDRAGPFSLGEIASRTGGEVAAPDDAKLLLHDVRALADAGPSDLSFIDNRRYVGQLATTRAGACLVAPALAAKVPSSTIRIVSRAPYQAFALALQHFYPSSMRPRTALEAARADGRLISGTAEIEAGAIIEPGAVIGREARIGRGTTIAAGAVIGYRVHIGRDGFVGPGATITHALVGDRVILHAGVRIGQDGFGFAMGPKGHIKVPQIGRVIIQDDVEIGANSTVDRGALKDTIIGEGSKIDNLVQIGHNVVVGRHCVLVAAVAIAGSTELGEFVVVGGQTAIAGHLKIGSGAQIAGAAGVHNNIPAGERWAGTPARPFKIFAREVAIVNQLARRGRARPADETGNED